MSAILNAQKKYTFTAKFVSNDNDISGEATAEVDVTDNRADRNDFKFEIKTDKESDKEITADTVVGQPATAYVSLGSDTDGPLTTYELTCDDPDIIIEKDTASSGFNYNITMNVVKQYMLQAKCYNHPDYKDYTSSRVIDVISEKYDSTDPYVLAFGVAPAQFVEDERAWHVKMNLSDVMYFTTITTDEYTIECEGHPEIKISKLDDTQYEAIVTSPGKYEFTAHYKGNDIYAPGDITNDTCSISRVPVSLDLIVNGPISITPGGTTSIRVSGIPSGESVRFTCTGGNEDDVHIVKNESEPNEWNVTIDAAGTYKIFAHHDESDIYQAAQSPMPQPIYVNKKDLNISMECSPDSGLGTTLTINGFPEDITIDDQWIDFGNDIFQVDMKRKISANQWSIYYPGPYNQFTKFSINYPGNDKYNRATARTSFYVG